MFSREERSQYNDQQQGYFIGLFTKAKNENKRVIINNNLVINVEYIYVSKSGCGQCGVKYNSIEFNGLVYSENYICKYYASISSFYLMCECDPFDEPYLNKSLLLKCLIDKKHDYIYDCFIDEDSINLL